MRVLAVLFRLLSLIGVLALVAFLWLKFDTNTKQQVAFLDEVVEDAYQILQSEKEAQWKDISEKEVLLTMFLTQANKFLMESQIYCQGQWTHSDPPKILFIKTKIIGNYSIMFLKSMDRALYIGMLNLIHGVFLTITN